jgi:hypothetical protein
MRAFLAIILLAATACVAQTAHYRQHGPATLNDLAATPGATTGMTAAQLCAKDFRTGTVRNVTEATKRAACAAYGIAKADCVGTKVEIDHAISLELGGSNDLKNLWPEPYLPKPGAREKDQVEDALHRQACAGTITLQQAQKEIVTDWYAVYLTIHPAASAK